MIVSNRPPISQDCICPIGFKPSKHQPTLSEDPMAVLGHEIRNPLSALTYALQAWPTFKQNPQLEQRLLKIMRRQVKQLTKLCDELLDSEKTVQGSLSICRASMDLRQSLENASEEIRPLVESRGQTLTIEFGNLPRTLYGDESRLTQVFANLMHNSTKFTQRGGHVHISVESQRDLVVIRLCDNGRGMSSEQLRNIFRSDRASRNSSRVAGAGLGIGLQLAKSIVELHGGTIEALSEGLGHGSTIVVRLPISAERSPEIDSQPLLASVELEECNSLSPDFRIVVVDDDRSSRFLVSNLLQKLNQKVTVAENGEKALEIIDRIRPDVVLLDLQMHGMDGYEMARQIRGREDLQGVVLIALSGSANAESRERAADSGFDQYLVKPTSLTELSMTIHKIAEDSACCV